MRVAEGAIVDKVLDGELLEEASLRLGGGEAHGASRLLPGRPSRMSAEPLHGQMGRTYPSSKTARELLRIFVIVYVTRVSDRLAE